MLIYLIGYEKAKLDEFIALLKINKVNYLIDIRENPFSMRKDFIKKYLKKHLEEKGIKYIYLKELGNPKEIRKEYKETKDIKLALYRYSKYIKNNLTKNIEDYIENLLEDGNIAFMCYEKNPLECHRTILAYELYRRGVVDEIKDIRTRIPKNEILLYCENISNYKQEIPRNNLHGWNIRETDKGERTSPSISITL